MHQTILQSGAFFFLQGDIEKGLEMKKLVLSGFLASEEIYINQLEALLLVIHTHTCKCIHTEAACVFAEFQYRPVVRRSVVNGHVESRTSAEQLPGTSLMCFLMLT